MGQKGRELCDVIFECVMCILTKFIKEEVEQNQHCAHQDYKDENKDGRDSK